MKPVARDILIDNRGQHSQYHHVFELVPGQPNHGSVCLLACCLANLLNNDKLLMVRDDTVPACWPYYTVTQANQHQLNSNLRVSQAKGGKRTSSISHMNKVCPQC